jgi:hypothetical protein
MGSDELQKPDKLSSTEGSNPDRINVFRQCDLRYSEGAVGNSYPVGARVLIAPT